MFYYRIEAKLKGRGIPARTSYEHFNGGASAGERVGDMIATGKYSWVKITAVSQADYIAHTRGAE